VRTIAQNTQKETKKQKTLLRRTERTQKCKYIINTVKYEQKSTNYLAKLITVAEYNSID